MKPKTINRSAKTGKFVTKTKAKKSPNTTVKEKIFTKTDNQALYNKEFKKMLLGLKGQIDLILKQIG